jgi:hypothetical protein
VVFPAPASATRGSSHRQAAPCLSSASNPRCTRQRAARAARQQVSCSAAFPRPCPRGQTCGDARPQASAGQRRRGGPAPSARSASRPPAQRRRAPLTSAQNRSSANLMQLTANPGNSPPGCASTASGPAEDPLPQPFNVCLDLRRAAAADEASQAHRQREIVLRADGDLLLLVIRRVRLPPVPRPHPFPCPRARP